MNFQSSGDAESVKTVTVQRAEDGALPELELAPETRVQLQIGRGPRTDVQVLGLARGRYVVLRGGEALGRYELNYGDTVLLRYFHEGVACAFRSYVLNAVQTPEPVLFVAHPHIVEQCRMRQAQRLTCTLPCRLKLGGPVSTGMIVDISASGCRAALRAGGDWAAASLEQSVGRDVELGVQLPGAEGEVWLPAVVRRTEREDRRVCLGMQFLQPQAQLVRVLEAYLQS